MATLSFGSLLDNKRPSLWNLEEMKRVQMADGTTFDQVIGDVNAALSALNSEMLTMSNIAGMLAVQDSVEVEYPSGVSNGIEDATEFSTPTPARGKTTGHSIPTAPYMRALGWTMMYLRAARQAKLDADVRSMIDDARGHWQKSALTRFFKSTASAVGGTSGQSVPLADGGTADSNYTPPTSPEGKTFASSHTHFLRYDTVDNAIAAAVPHLREHGYASPFEFVASEADAATIKAATGWRAPTWPEINYMAAADKARQVGIDKYFGFIETAWGVLRVVLSPRVPTGYFGLYKSFGQGDARNPLRVRINPLYGFGWQLLPGNWVNAPTMLSVGYAEYGFGIGEHRTNGVCVKIAASGDYSDPTIS